MPAQQQIIKQFNKYLAHKNYVFQSNHELIDFGLCSGLVAYWLYLLRTDKIKEFDIQVKNIATWNPTQKHNQDIDQFLDNILALGQPAKVIPWAQQQDLATSFMLTTDKYKVANEFSLTFIFDKAALEILIAQISKDRKMMRISDGLHVIGLMLLDNMYHAYDPNKEPLLTDDLTKLVAYIDEGFGRSTDYSALNISIYDIAPSTPTKYLDPVQYCAQQLNNPRVKELALAHEMLFYVLAKYNEYKIMDLMFAIGFKYERAKLMATSEMNEAIIFHNATKLQYLLDNNIPIDSDNIRYAIEQQSLDLLMLLLANDANVNAKHNNDKSYIEMAIANNFVEAIVLLLAAGFTLGKVDKQSLTAKYSENGLKMFYANSLNLLKIVCALPDSLELTTITPHVYANLAKYLEMAAQFEIKSAIQITDNGASIAESMSLKEIEHKVLIYAAIAIANKFDSKDYQPNATEISDAKFIIEQIRILNFELGADEDTTCEEAISKIQKYLKTHEQIAHATPNLLFKGHSSDPKVEEILTSCRVKLKS